MARRDSAQKHADRYDTEAKAGRALTLIFGLTFLAVGIWGFALTGFDGDWFAHDTGEEILGLFEVNGFHNLAHVLFGVTGIIAAGRLAWSLGWNTFTAVAYGGLFVYGLFAVDETWDFLAVNWGDNWLHLGLSALAVVVAGICYKALSDMRQAATIDLRERAGAPDAGVANQAGDTTGRSTRSAAGRRQHVR